LSIIFDYFTKYQIAIYYFLVEFTVSGVDVFEGSVKLKIIFCIKFGGLKKD